MAAQSENTHRTRLTSGPLPPEQRPACVVIIQGEGLGQRFDIEEHPVIVGRSGNADLQINHNSVSRQHCKLWREADRYLLLDLGATNRTRLNEAAIGIDPIGLSDGDHITVGEVVLKFISRSSIEAVYHEEVYQLATQDALTELCNRRHFDALLRKEIARAQRHGRPLALGMIDIDHFKRINDTYGHADGDRVLRAIADCLREHTRIEDVIARVGGEEFCVLFPETNEQAARMFAERLRQAIEASTPTLGGEPTTVTISIGVAMLGANDDALSLTKAADGALYRAKNAGRNQVRMPDA